MIQVKFLKEENVVKRFEFYSLRSGGTLTMRHYTFGVIKSYISDSTNMTVIFGKVGLSILGLRNISAPRYSVNALYKLNLIMFQINVKRNLKDITLALIIKRRPFSQFHQNKAQ